MLEMCPRCGALERPGQPHVCADSSAHGSEVALDLEAVPIRPEPRAPTVQADPSIAVAGLAVRNVAGAPPSVWRWSLPDGHALVLEIEPTTNIETVRLAG